MSAYDSWGQFWDLFWYTVSSFPADVYLYVKARLGLGGDANYRWQMIRDDIDGGTGLIWGAIKHWYERARDRAEEIRDELDAAHDWVRDKATTVWDWIANKAGTVWNWIHEKSFLVWDWITGQGQAMWGWFDERVWLWDRIYDRFRDKLWRWLETEYDKVVSWFNEHASGLTDWISNKASVVWDWINNKASTVWDWITNTGQNIKTWFDKHIWFYTRLYDVYRDQLWAFLEDPGRFIRDHITGFMSEILERWILNNW